MRSILELLRDIYERLTAGGTTEQQAVQSGVWVAGINVGDRVLQLLNVIILARLLSPEAFGLLGIALVVMMALNQFSRLGFDEALIHNEKEDIDDYLNTLWVMKIGRTTAVAVIAILIGPPLAEFFGEPQAGRLIQVLGGAQLLLGLQNPGIVYFQKDLNFHREFVYQVGSRFTDLVVAVAFALVFRSVWALVAGNVASKIVKLVMSYAIHSFRPIIEFELDYAKEMFDFGKWMFISTILMFLYGQADDAFVGWFFTASALGFYQLAYRFSNAPATEVTHVISRVVFPALSQVQNDIERLREGYLRALQLSTVIAFPMAAGIFAIAPQFVPIFLGNQWEPMIPLMQALAVWGGIRAFGANGGGVFKAVGRPDIPTKLQAVKVLVIALTIYPAAEYFDVVGVAYAIIGSSFFVLPPRIYFLLSIIQADIWTVVNHVMPPLIMSTIMCAVVLSTDLYILSGTGLPQFISLVVLGVVTYSISMFMLDAKTGYDVRSIYESARNSV
ncbi:lipopolysaccharide biosynthesis protein [Halorubrum ezzemoulense]|uniref:lipopolysaccharide biosynthesis protein n=1 Tax=Halorubrum ezzemoulense TaxID=337243 RepID=UPI00232AD1D9|nr:lipopolysaccharide biosynthesis protein [Halorubrum ezzemoulense]MDB2282657.1 lipopolysaccharide biosynthesis protein [Halorubrum ezzemoulense]